MTHRDVFTLTSRFLEGYGIAESPVDRCTTLLESQNRGRDAPLRRVSTTTDPSRALDYLSLLSWPASRHVVFAANASWSTFINNRRNGSDYADERIRLALHLDTRFARIVSHPVRVWSRGSEHETLQHAATIFDLCDRNGESIRSVACMNDGGRWVFVENGARHAIESSFPYDARSKRKRFTSEELHQLMLAHGLPIVTEDVFLAAACYHLYETPHPPQNTCTLAEEDDPAYGYYCRGLGWVRHMDTHASSVIADFERCIEINPNYETKVREYLDRAYHIVQEQ